MYAEKSIRYRIRRIYNRRKERGASRLYVSLFVCKFTFTINLLCSLIGFGLECLRPPYPRLASYNLTDFVD